MKILYGRGFGRRESSHLHQIFLRSEFRSLIVPNTHNATTFSYRGYSSTRMNMTETKWTAQVVRKQFLDYFKDKGHTIGTSQGS